MCWQRASPAGSFCMTLFASCRYSRTGSEPMHMQQAILREEACMVGSRTSGCQELSLHLTQLHLLRVLLPQPVRLCLSCGVSLLCQLEGVHVPVNFKSLLVHCCIPVQLQLLPQRALHDKKAKDKIVPRNIRMGSLCAPKEAQGKTLCKTITPHGMC